MGESAVAMFATLAVLGISLVTVGTLRRARILVVAGSALLFALTGAWIIGLPGAAFGVLAFGFWRRRRSGNGPEND